MSWSCSADSVPSTKYLLNTWVTPGTSDVPRQLENIIRRRDSLPSGDLQFNWEPIVLRIVVTTILAPPVQSNNKRSSCLNSFCLGERLPPTPLGFSVCITNFDLKLSVLVNFRRQRSGDAFVEGGPERAPNLGARGKEGRSKLGLRRRWRAERGVEKESSSRDEPGVPQGPGSRGVVALFALAKTQLCGVAFELNFKA